MEAIRELGVKVGLENCAYVHVVYLPYLGASNETKTKPAQNSVRELRGLGIAPDILVAAARSRLTNAVKSKLSLFSGVAEEAIALLPNAQSIYEVPLTLEDTGIADVIADHLGLQGSRSQILRIGGRWSSMATTEYNKTLKVGFVAKYMDNTDTYMSVFEALQVSRLAQQCDVDITWIDARTV